MKTPGPYKPPKTPHYRDLAGIHEDRVCVLTNTYNPVNTQVY
jgi:hypothetical protein